MARETETGVVVDLVERGRRITRLAVPDADPGGSLVALEVGIIRFGNPIVRVRWRNADADASHDYLVDGETIVPLS